MDLKKKYVILHGHFYQPPREDPWSGIIEHQESAYPFSNWNKRITAECYAACSASRVLDPEGRISSIVNNYKTLSFNFGPTLLSWLEENAPTVYRRIIEADHESVRRLGHGNAMAQAYNHTMLPLEKMEDTRLEIRWGLEDFRHRFGRDAEGIWLPECGVNEKVVDILIEEGLSFVILSPWQAKSIRSPGKSWKELGGKPAPSNRPFRIIRPGGEIAVFFYHPELASGISFGHLLTSREGFENAIRDALDKDTGSLVSIATDGEIYGHHEPFGDMCLASLTEHLGEDSDLCFTNCAAYLETHPAMDEVRLRAGDDKLGTSWSCVHGVGRWMRDCGCSTGGQEGWNQAWRTPLRKAFDALRDAAVPRINERLRKLCNRELSKVIDEYVRVISGAETAEAFSERILTQAECDNPEAKEELLRLLHGTQFLEYMYTSCGWFFAELSGIEPIQNMRYAYRATELIDPDSQLGFAKLLEKNLSLAQSNIESMGNGADLLRGMVIPKIPPQAKAAALFFWRHLYNLPGTDNSRWGYWQGMGLSRFVVELKGEHVLVKGHIRFLEIPLDSTQKLAYRTEIAANLLCPWIEVELADEWVRVPIGSMPTSLRKEIQNALLEKSDRRMKLNHGTQLTDRFKDFRIVKALELPFGARAWQSLELSLHYGLLLLLDELDTAKPERWPALIQRLAVKLAQRDESGIEIDNDPIEKKMSAIASRLAEELQENCNSDGLENFVNFLELVRRYGYRPVKPMVQNAVYYLLEQRFGMEQEALEEICGFSDDNELLNLARLVNINPEKFLKITDRQEASEPA